MGSKKSKKILHRSQSVESFNHIDLLKNSTSSEESLSSKENIIKEISSDRIIMIIPKKFEDKVKLFYL